MSDIKIVPVTTKKGLRAFIQFYYDLYKGNKFAVPFLRLDEWNTLSKDKNPAFEFCDAQYFLAIDYSVPKVVGRVAAIINHRANEQWNKKQVRASAGSTSSTIWRYRASCWMPLLIGEENTRWKRCWDRSDSPIWIEKVC